MTAVRRARTGSMTPYDSGRQENEMPEKETWTHETATINGIRTHYVHQGKGPLVLLLHGFPENWYSWRFQLPALAESFHVVAPDLRGYNETEIPGDLAAYRMEHLVEDAAGLIRHLGEESAYVVGHDWGGVVAFQLAAEHPELVKKLAILNAPHPFKCLDTLRRNTRQLRRSWYMFFFQLPWLPERFIERDDYAFLRRAFRGTAVNKEAFPREVLNRFIDPMRRTGALTAGINYYRANLRNPGSLKKAKNFPVLTMPTRIIWGEEDVALDIVLTRDLDDFFSGPFDLRTIPNCGHWVQQEEPELVNRYLSEFLTEEKVC